MPSSLEQQVYTALAALAIPSTCRQHPLDLRRLGAQIGAGALSLASPERLMTCLGLEPGSVGPFGLLHPGAKEITILVEARLRGFSHAGFHPNVNTATLTLAWPDFERFLALMGNPVIWIQPLP